MAILRDTEIIGNLTVHGNYINGLLIKDKYSNTTTEKYTMIGASADDESQRLVLGVGGTTVYAYITEGATSWTVTSDMRDKTDFKNITDGLNFILKLNPVTYVTNTRDNYIENGIFNDDKYQKGILKGNRRHAGFIAQEVYESMIDTYHDDNYAALVDYNNYDENNMSQFDRYYMRYSELIPFLVKAVQEQQETINSICDKIEIAEKELSNLESLYGNN